MDSDKLVTEERWLDRLVEDRELEAEERRLDPEAEEALEVDAETW